MLLARFLQINRDAGYFERQRREQLERQRRDEHLEELTRRAAINTAADHISGRLDDDYLRATGAPPSLFPGNNPQSVPRPTTGGLSVRSRSQAEVQQKLRSMKTAARKRRTASTG